MKKILIIICSLMLASGAVAGDARFSYFKYSGNDARFGLKPSETHLTGNFTVVDNFEGPELDPTWIFLRNPIPDFYTLSDKGLIIHAAEGSIEKQEPISALFRRQQHADFVVETEVDFEDPAPGDFAGLALLQNENFNFIFGKICDIETSEAGLIDAIYVVLQRNDGNESITQGATLSGNKPLRLKVEGKGKLYSFYYAHPPKNAGDEPEWIALATDVDASNLSTAKTGGFIGTVIGLYARSSN